MELEAHVKDGVVVLDTKICLPEGIHVRVITDESVPVLPTLAERFKSVAGKARDLPADLAACHDQYLHGDKKQALSQK